MRSLFCWLGIGAGCVLLWCLHRASMVLAWCYSDSGMGLARGFDGASKVKTFALF